MTYEELYEKMYKEGNIRLLSYQIKTWEVEGDYIIGKVMEVKPFTGGSFDTDCLSYLIKTDEGLFTTVLGSATDTQINQTDLRGKIISIVYKGKKDLKDQRRVNIFDVAVLTTDEKGGI